MKAKPYVGIESYSQNELVICQRIRANKPSINDVLASSRFRIGAIKIEFTICYKKRMVNCAGYESIFLVTILPLNQQCCLMLFDVIFGNNNILTENAGSAW